MEKKSTTAPYGRACMNCSKAKVRCIISAGNIGCERCHRLKKPCRPSDPTRKRSTLRDAAIRSEKLEQKIEGLVSLLSSVTQPVSPSTTSLLTTPTDPANLAELGCSSSDNQGIHLNGEESITLQVPPGPEEISLPSITPISQSTPLPSVDSHLSGSSRKDGSRPGDPPEPSGNEISPEEAERVLNIFRTKMLKSFAFLDLPSDLSAQKLSRDRPFLFRSIVAVVTVPIDQKLRLGRLWKETLAREMIVESNGSIDLVLGILTFLSWSNDQVITRSNFSRFTRLAISVICDLRLNKPPVTERNTWAALGLLDQDNEPRTELGHTLEEKRAVLACYLFSCIVSTVFGSLRPMPWTAQMEEHLHVIENNESCATDRSFALQIRLQLLSQRAAQFREQEIERGHVPTMPLPFHLKLLQSQFQEIKNSIYPRFQHDYVLLTHMHYAELSLYDSVCSSKLPLTCDIAGYQRIECLSASLAIIKSWTEFAFSPPASEMVGCSFVLFWLMGRFIAGLYRLSILEDPAWDRNTVRQTADVLSVLDKFIESMGLISQEAGEKSGDGVYKRVKRMMSEVRAWCSVRLEPEVPGTYSPTAIDQDLLLQSFDGSDDTWLQNFFSWSG